MIYAARPPSLPMSLLRETDFVILLWAEVLAVGLVLLLLDSPMSRK